MMSLSCSHSPWLPSTLCKKLKFPQLAYQGWEWGLALTHLYLVSISQNMLDPTLGPQHTVPSVLTPAQDFSCFRFKRSHCLLREAYLSPVSWSPCLWVGGYPQTQNSPLASTAP